MRLIDADAMRAEWLEDGENEYVYDTNCMLDSIDKQPTIEAEPVRHGKWVKAQGMMPPEHHHRHVCYWCNGSALQDFFGRERLSIHCPHCGAKMDLE